MIDRCLCVEHPGWLALRQALWSWDEAEHREEMVAFVAEDTKAAFVASDNRGQPQGFVEVGLRHDYVNGATSSPVAFLEGIYVASQSRGRGVARELLGVAETWAASHGCSELASDVLIDNVDGLAAHSALGFRETERVVYFIKTIG
jgi:aminoglycoside 6'-N-acetyltransferase I